MATDTAVSHEVNQEQDLWSGGKSPFKVSYGKIMIWYFLLSDAFTFAGFLIAYGAIRFSMDTWPVPDFVFSTFPGLSGSHPLLFVTVMTFVLLFSSFTMMRAVQEGHRENKNGIVFWMTLTIIGGFGFLGCQAWEWSTLIAKEHMSVTRDPFGTHTAAGVYLGANGEATGETFEAGSSYLMHRLHVGDGHHGEEGGHDADAGAHGADESHGTGEDQGTESTAGHATESDHGGDHHASYPGPGDYNDAWVDEQGFIHRKYMITEGAEDGMVKYEEFGPKAFGALFFFITGFHGFHVFSGVVFLLIILINVASGLYVKRRNGYEMVEKIGLYWHFVDLVWVFVFLVFYLI